MGRWNNEVVNFSTLIGKTLASININHEYDEIIFTTTDGEEYMMNHSQACCEHVTIEDICGDIQDIVGEEILDAYAATNNTDKPLDSWAESYTWTFYTIRTMHHTITIRWYGESNGCYSEEVDFWKVAPIVKLDF